MTAISSPAAEYVKSVNEGSPALFAESFAANAVVDDAGRRIEGIEAIRAWGEREIFAANVSFDVLSVVEVNGAITITTKVDGSYDKTGLPDPLVMSHRVESATGKILRLTIGFADWPAK